MQTTTNLPYTLGLDIGIASVGWCLLGDDRIIDLGVRCFDKAETPDRGESLNKVRRDARLARRRLRRRTWRLTKLARLFKHAGLTEDARLVRDGRANQTSPWQLRVEGLDRRLSREEWARALYHVVKHRGFHWISRAEAKKAESDKGEGGRVKQGLDGTARRMKDKGYRSAAEMVLREFPEAQRNKRGEYNKALSRSLLAAELTTLFERQRELGNPYTGPDLKTAILGNGDRKSGLLWIQKPPLSGNDLLNMLGKCTFERDEYRAPKASFTAERHVWLTRLNNLRVIIDGTTRPLSDAERELSIPLPYKQSGDFTYKQLRAALLNRCMLPDSFRFSGLSYPLDAQQDAGKVRDPESDRLIRLPAWQELRKELKKNGLETEWESIAGMAAGGHPELFDQIAWVLSVFKDGDEVVAELRKLRLPGGEKMVEALSQISFDKFHNLSLKALRRIVPHMEGGLRYDEACAAAGYHHSDLQGEKDERAQYLPSLYSRREKNGRMVFRDDIDIPRNPVVLRAINQARAVVNAIVRRYGSPSTVHIEMARDLSRPMDERREVEKAQKEYRDRNEKLKSDFASEYGIEPKGREFEKFLLYKEQGGKCAYSLKPLDLDRVLRDLGYAEVDHALPYSRSFDDSKNNKVLVLAEENRNKGNRTPCEYLDGANDSPRWREFSAFVGSNKAYRIAKRTRLLRKDFAAKSAEEFRDRNLNDTRYICKFFKNYVERFLKLADDSANHRCVVLSGQLTAFLRARWGLVKARGDSDRHHALDAAVVAACSHGMVKRLSDYARRHELENARAGFVDFETGEIVDTKAWQQLERNFPSPWPHFRDELLARLHTDDPANLRRMMQELGTYPQRALEGLRPLFVSRAPQRRNGGAAHKDTIYGRTERFEKNGENLESRQIATQKVPLSELTLRDIDDLIDPHRNEKLYEAIRARLTAHGGKGEKAFPPDSPLRKPGRDGNPTGPIVRAVTMAIDKISGIPVRGGIAKNDSMLRIDVFRCKKDGRFHLVPLYVHHAAMKTLPDRAIVQGKNERDWTHIDDGFSWCFSLYPNDLARISLKNECHLGYYAGCDRSTGTISLWAHDRNRAIGKDGLIRGIGAKTAALIEKFHVDTLGNIYPAAPEPRRGLA